MPTLAEFQALSSTVGGDGNALKAIGQGSGTNSSGFSALLTGDRTTDGNFQFLGIFTCFWSSTEFNASDAYYLELVQLSKCHLYERRT